MPEKKPEPQPARTPEFPVTHWTLIQQLRGSESEASRALDEICRNYWFPIYSTLRRNGHSPHDAEDLTQGFFADFLRDESLLNAEASRGRLRSFLLGALKRFLADDTRRRLAQKRGAGAPVLSLEWERASERYVPEPADERDPEKIYFQTWVWGLVERVREKLRAGYAGREQIYAKLEPFIEGDAAAAPFRELGALLGQTESGARVTVFRLRQRFREILTEAVQATVETPQELAEEMAWVQGILRERG